MKPFVFKDISVYPGDNRVSLRALIDQGVRVHSVVTDPPYGLTVGDSAGGFMGAVWDATRIERDPEFWKLIYNILLPGGYVFAFSGSRTGHWQACAMEMAGFAMHPMHGWVQSQGFPKAVAADKAIDKMLGATREVVGFDASRLRPNRKYDSGAIGNIGGSGTESDRSDNGATITAPATPEAALWKGWAYGSQSQKPALEPIYLGQKPFSEKTGAANILKHGVGAVNIDGCRVPTTDNLNGGAYAEVGGRKESPSMHTGTGMNVPGKTTGKAFVQPSGRHPANLILDGSPEVLAMFPDGKSGDPGIRRKDHQTHSMSGTLGTTGTLEVGYGDSGSNARFFHQFPHTDEDYFYAQHLGLIGEDRGDALVYNAKATSADRVGSMHPTVKPVALMRYLVRHITPPGGIVLDPFAGSGTTGEAARQEGMQCILMEAEPEYVDFLKTRFHLKYEPEQQPSNEEVEEKDDSFIFLGGKPIF